ncbi:hypothetical protein BJX61DRAFT_543540 [Aspergillus egyptiacus]|nr:hypothetical protein BJX61DRAFT_543540 [Aspergillus egyptiacus]
MAPRTFEEVDNPRRVDLINKLTKLVDDCPVNSALWALIWLADIDRLEKYVDQLAAAGPVIAASHCESNFSTKALKIWTTRGHVGKVDSVTEESRKRKWKGDNSYEESQSKSVRSAERPTDEAAVFEAERPRGRSPAKSRLHSRTKIPIVCASDQVGSATPGTPATPSTPAITRATSPKPQSHNRSDRTITQCKLRDGGLCLITKGGDVPEAAHIYASSIGSQVGRTRYKHFWDIFRMFWSEKKIKSWEAGVLGNEGTETTLPNLLCMDPTVHALWGKARFAIKPLELSSDRKKLRVELHWLPAMKYVQRQLGTAPSSLINTISAPGGTRLYDCPTDRRIQTGDVLTFTTNDPENLPLPSVDLLDMQWVLNRLTALSGAADVSDEELDSDDAPGQASPICVGEGIDISLSEKEAERGQEQQGG